MIPQEKAAAVTRGLREALGVTTFEEIRRLTGGHTSALVFRIIVRGHPYSLRIIMRSDDPTRHFVCMKTAAEAGLTPHVWYASIEDRISITDFVEAVPFRISEALVRLPAALRNLHALPPFPGAPNHLNTTCTFLLKKGPALDGFIQSFRAANILAKDESDELFARYAQVAAVYPLDDSDVQSDDMVSSHNDLFKPDNILFDGRCVWLVDWEAAFLNDRYADLAVVANLVVTNGAEESAFLKEYVGQAPGRYQLARFLLTQQVAHIFYAMVFLLLGSTGEAPVTHDENTLDFRDFQRGIWAGEINLADNRMKTVYGRVHRKQMLENVRQARFDKALITVANQH